MPATQKEPEDFFSHLDDALENADKQPSTPKEVIPFLEGFSEKCTACRGTGNFYSWAGRYLGPCHKCQGKDMRFYKTSPAARAQAKQTAATRKATQQETNLAAFEAANPDIAAWWANSTFPFAISLRETVIKYGALSEKLQAAKEAAQAAKAAAPTVTLDKIDAAFAAAKASGLKWLKLNLDTFRFSVATEQSKNPGAIYVKDVNQGTYLGKIQDGKFFAARECSADVSTRILAAAADPHQAAVAYGKQTGRCSCCGRELTNDESIELGIGPICRSKWGW